MKMRVKVEGMSQLREALLQLPRDMRGAPLRRALRDGATIVQARAQELAPVDDGTTKRAIYISRNRAESSDVRETFIVGIRYGKRYRKRGMDAWYWWFLEFGTSKMVAHPFMRPAFDATREAQVEAIRKRLAEDIRRAADKIRLAWNRSMGRRAGQNA